MLAGVLSLSSRVSLGAAAFLALIATDALAQAQIIQLLPQDTTININRSNYSTQPVPMAYTWPDYTKANAILLKFDLSALPAGATISEAVLSMALVGSDQTADATYTITAHKLLRTAANAAMQFNQLVIAPYIGDGSPVTQTLWIDNLTVATGR